VRFAGLQGISDTFSSTTLIVLNGIHLSNGGIFAGYAWSAKLEEDEEETSKQSTLQVSEYDRNF